MISIKAVAVFTSAILLLSAILLVEPAMAQPTQSSFLVSFTMYGWVWSPDYAQYGIGNATLTITNGNITYSSDSTWIWNFSFPNCQLNFTIQPGITQMYTVNLTGSKTKSIMQLGDIDAPTRSDFSGFWLDSNYTWIKGHIYLAPIEGGVFNSTSPYYFVIRTRNVEIPLSLSANNSVASGVDSIINNLFKIIEDLSKQMYLFRAAISAILDELTTIFTGIRNSTSPYIP